MGILDFLIGLLLIIWIGGLVLNVTSGFIHLLVVIALVLLIVRLFQKAT